MQFAEALDHILLYEGGLVDHPQDPGGITKYGISLRAYPELGADGIRNLTKKKAGELYKRDYWDAAHCADFPDYLRLMLFDCAVNQGVGYAVKAAQAAVNAKTDGTVGPKTIDAAKRAEPHKALHKFAMNRFLRYKNNKNWNVFGDGWASRLLSVLINTRCT